MHGYDLMTLAGIDLLGLPAGVVLLAAAVLLAVVVLGYRRDRGLVPPWVGRVLIALRISALVLLLLLFLEVAWRRVGVEARLGDLLVIYDFSRSMDHRDEFRPGWQKVREAAALGLFPSGLRETGPEVASRRLLGSPGGEIPVLDWERIRRFARERGIPSGVVEEAERDISLRAASARVSGSPDAAAPAREALARALESFQRRLDEGLIPPPDGSSDPRSAVREGLAKLEPLSRLALARALLEGGTVPSPGGAPLLELLARRLKVSTVALGRAGDRFEAAGEVLLSSPGATSPGLAFTDLGQPVLDALAEKDRETLAAVVLVSDGRHNRGRRPEDVMDSLRARSVPLFTLGVGSEDPPRDARIAEVDATGKVFAGDEVKAGVAIHTVGMGALSLPLTISEGERVVKEIAAEIPGGDGLTHLSVSFQAPDGPSGPRKFTVSFPPQPGEVSSANNSRELWVDILTEKARVLLLDGGPRWEYRYLKSSLERDPNVKLEAFLVTRPPERRLPEGFPRERDPLYAHEVIVLGDVEASVFSEEELAAVRDFVLSRGGSLVLVAGQRAMPDDYAETALEEALPVRLRSPRPPQGEGAVLGRGGFRLLLTAEGERSPITRLVPGREPNRELWSLLPPMDWFAPVAAARPSAEVLVALPPEFAGGTGGEDGAPDGPPAARAAAAAGSPRQAESGRERRGVLMATLPFGAGRVFYSGVDSTWRWRYHSGDELFSRFWGQVIRWAASERLPPGDQHVRLAAGELRYQAPAKVAIRALVEQGDGSPLEGATVDAVVRHVGTGAERRVRLEPIPRSGGLYRGAIEMEGGARGAGLGEHRIQLEVLELPGYSARPDRATATFIIQDPPSPEGDDLARDPELLARMASRAGPGGRYLPIDRASELPGLVPDRTLRREETTVTEQWFLAWPILLLFAALVAAEWALRKRFDLV